MFPPPSPPYPPTVPSPRHPLHFPFSSSPLPAAPRPSAAGGRGVIVFHNLQYIMVKKPMAFVLETRRARGGGGLVSCGVRPPPPPAC
eukprot:9197376-Pyramimonas_sp.AAC.2